MHQALIIDSGKDIIVPGCGLASATSPIQRDALGGVSVGYTRAADGLSWFPIRATFNRAQKVYDFLMQRDMEDRFLEPYMPLLRKVIYSNDDFDNPSEEVRDVPLDPTLLFVKTSHDTFRYILSLNVPGLTPLYNHFETNIFGKNDFLTVPDRQMESFRIIVESGIRDILIDQQQAPKFLKGDNVIVIGGPFAGVEGKILRYQSQKRVFVDIPGLGCFGTAYVPSKWVRKVEGSERRD